MADPRVLVLQPGPDDPVGRVGEWLTAAELDFEVRDLAAGHDVPPSLDGYAGLIVLGGGMGAADDDDVPYLPAVRARLRTAVSSSVPTLGICLGAQLLALANGGRVGRNPEGPEYGAQLIAKRAAAAKDPLFGPLPITPDVIQWHVDAVTTLPPGSVHLASSPGSENQAFRLGRLAWGIQFHIETTPAVVREWAASDAASLEGYDVERILARSDAAHDDVAEVWAPFVAAFAGIVRDPGSVAPAGPSISTGAPITDPAAIRAALAAEANSARTVLPMPGLRPPGHG